MHKLIKSGLLLFTRVWWTLVLRIVIATLAMLLVLLVLGQTSAQWLAWSDLYRVGYMTGLCAAGGAIYVLILWLLGVRPALFRA
jgi:putative peptidoglycan lipid II flippase